MSPHDPEIDEAWPREYFLRGHVAVEFARDEPAFETYKSQILPRTCDEYAMNQDKVKLAPGHSWYIRWNQVEQHEVDLWVSAQLPYYTSRKEAMAHCPYRAGDQRYRATGMVVPA